VPGRFGELFDFLADRTIDEAQPDLRLVFWIAAAPSTSTSSLSFLFTVCVQPLPSVICSIVIADVVDVTVTVPPRLVDACGGPSSQWSSWRRGRRGRDVVDPEVGGGASRSGSSIGRDRCAWSSASRRHDASS
jgi:hypothetical protein